MKCNASRRADRAIPLGCTLLGMLALWALTATWAPREAHAQAHEHGAARLDIAVDRAALSLRLEAPLEALFGFERAPRNDAERKLVAAGVTRLRAADSMFRIDPAAACTLAHAEVRAAVLGIGSAAPKQASGEHHELEAEFEFRCGDASKAAFLEVDLFDAFARLRRVDVQVATQTSQIKRTLKRPTRRIALTR